jgi:hypothetical protein
MDITKAKDPDDCCGDMPRLKLAFQQLRTSSSPSLGRSVF